MKIKINQGEVFWVNLRTRMPFKYGIATMTRMPMVFVRLHVEVNGKGWTGIAADLLPPKWFTKDPAQAVEQEIRAMLGVIEQARDLAVGMAGESAFELWRELYQRQLAEAARRRVPPLLANFGTSLIERALIEAVGRAAGQPLAQMLRENQLGLRLGEIHPSLQGTEPAARLPERPLDRITIRHTVGLADPLSEHEIAPNERLKDGLPHSLAECIRTYGLRHFKIKINGRPAEDLDRLQRLALILEQEAPSDYAFSLDGNEQFKSLGDFQEFWEEVEQSESLHGFVRHLLFIEQPLHREAALEPGVRDGFQRWPGRPPIIIDESDATLESLPLALQLGYAGTSHKNCKGIFKGIANRCLLLDLERQGKKAVMSGEDLCNVGPVALLQDLAVMAALGIASVERNGHHYCAGLSMFSPSIQEQILRAHGDLYELTAAGWPSLKIRQGCVRVGSLNEAPLGVGFTLDAGQFTPADQWKPEV